MLAAGFTDDDVDQLQVAIREFLKVARLITPGQDTGVDVGMQSLDPSIQQFRESRELLQRVHLDPGVFQGTLGAAGRVHRDPELLEPAGEIDQSGLVGNAEKRVHGASGSGWANGMLTPGVSRYH